MGCKGLLSSSVCPGQDPLRERGAQGERRPLSRATEHCKALTTLPPAGPGGRGGRSPWATLAPAGGRLQWPRRLRVFGRPFRGSPGPGLRLCWTAPRRSASPPLGFPVCPAGTWGSESRRPLCLQFRCCGKNSPSGRRGHGQAELCSGDEAVRQVRRPGPGWGARGAVAELGEADPTPTQAGSFSRLDADPTLHSHLQLPAWVLPKAGH